MKSIITYKHYDYALFITILLGFKSFTDYETIIYYKNLKLVADSLCDQFTKSLEHFKLTFPIKYFAPPKQFTTIDQIIGFIKKIYTWLSVPFKYEHTLLRLIPPNNLFIEYIKNPVKMSDISQKSEIASEQPQSTLGTIVDFKKDILDVYAKKMESKTIVLKDKFFLLSTIPEFKYIKFIIIEQLNKTFIVDKTTPQLPIGTTFSFYVGNTCVRSVKIDETNKDISETLMIEFPNFHFYYNPVYIHISVPEGCCIEGWSFHICGYNFVSDAPSHIYRFPNVKINGEYSIINNEVQQPPLSDFKFKNVGQPSLNASTPDLTMDASYNITHYTVDDNVFNIVHIDDQTVTGATCKQILNDPEMRQQMGLSTTRVDGVCKKHSTQFKMSYIVNNDLTTVQTAKGYIDIYYHLFDAFVHPNMPTLYTNMHISNIIPCNTTISMCYKHARTGEEVDIPFDMTTMSYNNNICSLGYANTCVYIKIHTPQIYIDVFDKLFIESYNIYTHSGMSLNFDRVSFCDVLHKHKDTQLPSFNNPAFCKNITQPTTYDLVYYMDGNGHYEQYINDIWEELKKEVVGKYVFSMYKDFITRSVQKEFKTLGIDLESNGFVLIVNGTTPIVFNGDPHSKDELIAFLIANNASGHLAPEEH